MAKKNGRMFAHNKTKSWIKNKTERGKLAANHAREYSTGAQTFRDINKNIRKLEG